MKLKELKPGELFTKKPLESPKPSQVFLRGDYDRSTRRYEVTRFSDMSDSQEMKGDTEVYTDFVF